MANYNKLKSMALVLAAALNIGPAFLCIKIALPEISPITITFIRSLLGGIFLMVIHLILNGKFFTIKNQWKNLLILTLLLNIFPYLLVAYAEIHITSSLAGILAGLIVLFTTIFSHYFGRHEPFTKRKLIGIAIGFLGLASIYLPTLVLRNIDESIGICFMILSSIFLSAGTVYSRMHPLKITFVEMTGIISLFSAILLFPFVLLFSSIPNPQVLSNEAIGAVIVLGIITAGYVIFYKSVKHSGASYASLSTLIAPVIAIILGAVVLQETLTWNVYLGAFLIITSMLTFSPVFNVIKND